MNESFVFYQSFREALKNYDDEQFRTFINVLFDYAFDSKEPTTTDNNVLMFFNLIKPQIDANERKRKRGRENGAKGGRPKSENKNLK